MSSILGIIATGLQLLAPAIVWGIKAWVKEKERQEKSIKSFYEFIGTLEKKAQSKVAHYQASEKALEDLQKQIDEENKK